MNLTPNNLMREKILLAQVKLRLFHQGHTKNGLIFIQEKKDGIARFFDKATIFKMAAGSHLNPLSLTMLKNKDSSMH